MYGLNSQHRAVPLTYSQKRYSTLRLMSSLNDVQHAFYSPTHGRNSLFGVYGLTMSTNYIIQFLVDIRVVI